MDRFVAMIWDKDDPSRQCEVERWSEQLQRQSTRWKVVLDAEGLRVLSYHHRGEGPVITAWQDAKGIVIGSIFAKGSERQGRVRRLGESEAKRIAASRGDHLINRYWGNYLALWQETGGGRVTALRDPCGAVPCFMTKHNGTALLFAHMEDVAGLSGLRFTVDWNFLHSFIFFDFFVTQYTGLNEVTELLPGERLEISRTDSPKRTWAWNAADIARHPVKQPFEHAKDELRATVTECLAAWGKEYRNIVVQMSGGLDSSILACLLRGVSDAKIAGMHLVSIGYEAKEVERARLVAAHAGVELIESPVDLESEDIARMYTMPRLARPTMQITATVAEEATAAVGAKVGADCFMAGHGGDNLFLQRVAANHLLSDYVRLNGMGRDFWPTAYGASMIQMRPIWSAILDALRTGVAGASWQPYAFLDSERINRHRLLTSEAIASIPEQYMMHPWYAQAEKLPRGKADQLLQIVALNNYYMLCGDGLTRDWLLPYVSQPIVEFALRTPTYLLVQNGLDRALERHAFANLLPAETTRRTMKGLYALGQLKAKQRNLEELRTLILEGQVIQRGWLDRARTERMLTSDYLVNGGGSFFMDYIVCVEAWLSRWEAGAASSA